MNTKTSSRRSPATNALVAAACLLGLPLYGPGAATAQDPPVFRVIVHPSNPATSISRGVISRYFLKATTTWPGGKAIRLVDQKWGLSAREAFTVAVHRKSAPAVRAFWIQRVFSGRGIPPPEKTADAAVVAYVLANPGAIGYVSGTADVGKAKVIVITD